MMATLLLTLILTVLAGAGLAAGVLFGRAPVKGSCGGLAGCDACGRACTKGERR